MLVSEVFLNKNVVSQSMKSIFIFIYLLLFFSIQPITVSSQNEVFDSLQQAFLMSDGDESVQIMCGMAHEILNDDPVRSLEYARQAEALASTGKSRLLMSDAFKFQGDAFYELDSLKSAAFAYSLSAEIEGSLLHPRPEVLVSRLGDAGFCYQEMGLFDKSLDYFRRALILARSVGDTSEIAANLSNIAVSLKLLGKYGEAIETFNEALELDLHLGNESYLATDYNNIGMVYRAWLQYDLAVEFFEKALEIDMRLGNRHKLSARYSNISQVYLAWDSISRSISYLNKALEIDREMNAVRKIGIRLHGLGLSYMSQKDYKKAIEYLNEAQQTFQNLDLDFQMAIVMEHTGNAYAALNDFKNAEYFFQNSLKLSQQLGLKPTTIEAAKGLYKLYKNQGNYKKSLKYFEIFKLAEDSVFSEISARQINEFEIRYETEKKENENLLLTKDVQLLTKDIHIKTRNQWFLGTLIVALIVISLALYYAFSLKRKSLLQNRILFEKESELSKIKIDQVEKRNRHLQEVLFAEEEIKRLQLQSIEQKNHELTSAAILIANKNEVLEKLGKLADKMKCDNGNGQPEIRKEMLREIERQTDVESQWEQFRVHFESIHRSFFEKLHSNVASLTQTDLQMCAYIKLNMATKEIARLMNIAPESVNTHRYRLRKKLALPAEETLDGFVHGL